MRQGWCLPGCAAGNKEVDARFDLPRNQVFKRLLVDRSILVERRDEGSTTSAKLHENKITRIEQGWEQSHFSQGAEEVEQPRFNSLYFRPDIFKVEKSLFVHDPFRRAHRAICESAARFGIVTQVDRVRRRLKNYFVHSHDFAFAERSDLNFETRVFLQDLLNGYGCP